jgi:hypothetical protein
VLDALNVCGGDCLADADGDGRCDDEDSCVGTLDACGICNGPGDIYVCGCADIAEGECDCAGNVLDVLGVCGGGCEADADGDGNCDDEDSCVGALDVCGVCNGPGIAAGKCDCDDNVLDVLGVCGGDCLADANGDGICDEEEGPGDGVTCESIEAHFDNLCPCKTVEELFNFTDCDDGGDDGGDGEYDPCENKTPGDTCTLCDPTNTSCAETQEVKRCDSRNTCQLDYCSGLGFDDSDGEIICDCGCNDPDCGGTADTYFWNDNGTWLDTLCPKGGPPISSCPSPDQIKERDCSDFEDVYCPDPTNSGSDYERPCLYSWRNDGYFDPECNCSAADFDCDFNGECDVAGDGGDESPEHCNSHSYFPNTCACGCIDDDDCGNPDDSPNTGINNMIWVAATNGWGDCGELSCSECENQQGSGSDVYCPDPDNSGSNYSDHCHTEWRGDNYCDPECDCEENDYDGGDCDPYTIEFKNDGNSAYVVDEQNNPTITLCSDRLYDFTRTTSGHPLLISNTQLGGPLSADALSGNSWSELEGNDNRVVQFSLTGTYYYYCTAHHEMKGEIRVVEPQQVPNYCEPVILPDYCSGNYGVSGNDICDCGCNDADCGDDENYKYIWDGSEWNYNDTCGVDGSGSTLSSANPKSSLVRLRNKKIPVLYGTWATDKFNKKFGLSDFKCEEGCTLSRCSGMCRRLKGCVSFDYSKKKDACYFYSKHAMKSSLTKNKFYNHYNI